MVFVKDYVKEFYDIVRHKRIIVFVNMDVDAVCTCKILQSLFRCDHIQYSIIPVTGTAALRREFMENCEMVDTFVLVNCGGTVDLVDLLLPEDVTLFVFESRRPLHVNNIYSRETVRLLVSQDELDFPDYDELFRDEDVASDEENEDEAGEDSGGEPSDKRARRDGDGDDYLVRRRELRQWRENRKKRLAVYNQFAFFGKSASLTVFELAWKLSLDNNDVLWLAIVGSASYFVHRRTDYSHYVQSTLELQQPVSRLNQTRSMPEEARKAVSVDCASIQLSEELQLELYREWSLFESLRHSPSTACHFRIWTNRGMRRMQEFLADMGLSLVQSRQKYTSMDRKVREGLEKLIEEHGTKFGMDPGDVLMPAFRYMCGHKNWLLSSEVVLACTAALEDVSQGKNKTSSDRFWDALSVLSRDVTSGSYKRGVTLAIEQQEALLRQVRTFIDDGQVVSAGSFLYALVKEGSHDAKHFANPVLLHRLAVFTLEAFLTTSRIKKARSLPLVVASPYDVEKRSSLVLGIPPIDVVKKDNVRNCFGEVFKQAAESTLARTVHDSFDTNVIELKTEDRSKFFDALINILEV